MGAVGVVAKCGCIPTGTGQCGQSDQMAWSRCSLGTASERGTGDCAALRDDEFVKQFVNGKIYWLGGVARSHY